MIQKTISKLGISAAGFVNRLKPRKKHMFRKLLLENLEDRRVFAAVPLTGAVYNQNFDTLVNSGTSPAITSGLLTAALDGWAFAETGSANNTTYVADTGSTNSGNTYSYGAAAATERALGGLRSGSLVPTIGASFQNTTGSAFGTVNVGYTGEQWRLGATGRNDRLDFQFSTNATSLATGTWTDVNGLDFSGPISAGTVGALNGNAAANRTTVPSTVIPGLTLAAGATFWVRWVDLDVSGADDGLAIDDFSISTSAIATPGVTITETSGATAVIEGGATDTYSVVLQSAPTANVTIAINSGSQLTASPTSLTFTTANWATPQIVTVTAVDDSVAEGTHTGTITHTATSTHAAYNGIAIPSVVATITDNEVPIGNAILLTGSAYTQAFDSLIDTGTSAAIADGLFPSAGPLRGWGFSESGTNANATYAADTGASNAGNTYSYGIAGTNVVNERAFGGLQSSSLTPNIGALFANNTGSILSTINVAYTGEQWRLGDISGRNDRLDFQYSTDATSLSTGTWVDVDTLDFVAPITSGTVGALDGNLPANRVSQSGSIPGINIPVNGTFWIRLASFDATGSDDGLAIDDFNISTSAIATPGVIIAQTGGTTEVVEGGATDTYSISLQSAPTSNVTIALNSGTQLTANPTSLTFTTSNWATPQSVTVAAVDDTIAEGTHIGTIAHTATSSDANYNGISIPNLSVSITDNEVPISVAIPITGSVYTQNFDTLVSTGTSPAILDGLLTGGLTGWGFAESGTTANSTYVADNGNTGTGNTYSYGTTSATERALGGLQSGNLQSTVGALFVNSTASALTTVNINYTGEQWRLGATGRTDQLDFQYSTDATSLLTGTWIDVDSLDFVSPTTTGSVGPLDGNASLNQVAKSGAITTLNIPVGGTFWIRWQDLDISGADDGLAIDDFSISTSAIAIPGVIIAQTGGTTNVAEGGATDTYSVALQSAPTANVTISINPGSQVSTNLTTLTFTTANWATPQNVTVTAVDDAIAEGAHTGTITHTATSTDPVYNGISIGSVTALIADNDGSSTTSNLRIVSYNIASSSGTLRTGLETILAGIGTQIVGGFARQIDLVALQEVDVVGTATSAVAGLLNSLYSTTAYVAGVIAGVTSGGGTQGVVYNSQTLQLLGETAFGVVDINNQARQTLRHRFQPVSGGANSEFYVYNSHWKSADDTDSRSRRLVEAQAIRNNADLLGDGTNILYVGDFNTYRSSETSFQTMVFAGNGQAFDPINRLGAWTANASFTDVHTQAPLLVAPSGSGLTDGGLDDRFDFQLISGELTDGVGLEYRTGTYQAFGNNGSVGLNGSINDAGNTALSGLSNRTTILNLLTTVSDHLPIVADYTFTTVTTDTTPPTVVSFDDGDADNSITVGSLLTYTVTFSEDIDSATVSASDFNNAGTASINVGTITETTPGVFSVQVTPTTAGSLILRIPSGAVVQDVAGNSLVTPIQDNDTITVVTGDVTTTTTVISNPTSPLVFGAPVTFTATVSGNPSVGAVTFYAGPGLNNQIGAPVAVVNGQATSAATTSLPLGSSTIAVLYSGATGFTASSTSLVVTVNALANPSVSITSGNAVYNNAAYVATASITGNGAPVPTLTFEYYTNAAGTTPVFPGSPTTAPENAGTYFVRAFSAANAGNAAAQSAITQFQITPFALTASGTAANKIYNANTAATVTVSLGGVFSGDTVTGTASGTFADKNVANGKLVTIGGVALIGADANNYSVGSAGTATADITAKAITGNITAANKAFDGNTSATILTRSLTGVLPGDTVSYVGGTATFVSSAVGTGIVVNASGLSLSGADAGNYSVNTTAATTANITAAGSVVNRRVFYNGGTGGATGFGASTNFSATAGNPPVTAIDSKVALQPGQNSSFANYTNASFGLNGIIVDIANPTGTLTEADFTFAKGETLAQPGFVPFTANELLTTIVPTVTQYVGGGVSGSTRAKITFNNNSLRNTWVRVTVLANANTGLTANDVFYFGNVVGDVNASLLGGRYAVNPIDTSGVRNNQSTTPNSVLVDNIYDFNKTGNVNPLDTSVVRGNQQTAGIVRAISNAPARGIADTQVPAVTTKGSPVGSVGALQVIEPMTNSAVTKTAVSTPSVKKTDEAVTDLFAQSKSSVLPESSQSIGSIDDFFADLGRAE